MLSLTMRHELSHRLELEHKLLHELQMRYTLRLELLAALRDGVYREDTTCPRCYRTLSMAEILTGFREDPRDYTTECPSCQYRFEASIACKDRYGKAVLRFCCPMQTIDQLYGMSVMTPDAIRKENPSVYYSALVHFGGLAAAFAELGVEYSGEWFEGWEPKVIPFLGRLPDAEIARCVGVPARKVRALRVKEGIERFRKGREEW